MPEAQELPGKIDWSKLDRRLAFEILDCADLLTQCDSESAVAVVGNLNELLLKKGVIGRRARLISSFTVLEEEFVGESGLEVRQLDESELEKTSYHEGRFIGCGVSDFGRERHLTYRVLLDDEERIITASSLITTGTLRLERLPGEIKAGAIGHPDVESEVREEYRQSCGEATREFSKSVARGETSQYRGVLAYFRNYKT